MIGVYWGRFNPPHRGHMKVIRNCLNSVDFLVVAVGSAERKDEKRNPFSGSERVRMLEAYLKEERISSRKVKVQAVKDGKTYSEAIGNLLKIRPAFDIIFFSDEKSALPKMMRNMAKVRIFRRTGSLSSTKLRDAIARNKKWENMTGKSVVKLIKKLNGIERIAKVYRKE